MDEDRSRPAASRRSFLKASVGASTTAILAGCSAPSAETNSGGTTKAPENSPRGTVERLDAYPAVTVGSVADLETGDVRTFEYPLEGQENFLTKLGDEAWGGVGPDGDIVAFNSKCTHAGCSVTGQVAPEDNRAGPCPCHFTSFDLSKNGLVVLGQATTDLPQVDLEVEDGDVLATGIDGLVWGYHDNLRNGEPTEAARRAAAGGEPSAATETTEDDAGGLDGWMENVGNYDGVVDRTGTSEVTVTVGAAGNGGNFAFEPPAVEVSSGTTVVWEWTGEGGSHNVVAADGSFESELVDDEGHTFERTFDGAGTVRYVCGPHESAGMKGAVVVE